MCQEKLAYASPGQTGAQASLPHPDFSCQTCLHHIINFIVVDNQVSFNIHKSHCTYIIMQLPNVIKCQEFQDLLLLLHKDLQDKDIPHQSKLHQAIIKAWETWFKVLKQDLSVCLSPFDTKFLFIGIIHSKLQEESVSPKISGLTAIISCIFVLLGIG